MEDFPFQVTVLPTLITIRSLAMIWGAFAFFAYRVLKSCFILVVINDTKLWFHNCKDPSRIFGRSN